MTTTTIEAVDLDTGEVLEHLDRQPAEKLAAVLARIRADESERKRWAQAIEGELRRRLKTLDRTQAVFGDWEVEQTVTGQYNWDAVELEGVLRDLVSEGVVKAAEVVGVVTRSPVASRSAAAALLRRLTGPSAEVVRGTRTRTEKPGPLTVARSVNLLPAAEEAPPPSNLDIDAAAPPPPSNDLEDLFA